MGFILQSQSIGLVLSFEKYGDIWVKMLKYAINLSIILWMM